MLNVCIVQHCSKNIKYINCYARYSEKGRGDIS